MTHHRPYPGQLELPGVPPRPDVAKVMNELADWYEACFREGRHGSRWIERAMAARAIAAKAEGRKLR